MAYGGAWVHDKNAGIMFRDMLPSNTDDTVWLDVASSNTQKYGIIRMIMMSTKIYGLLFV